MDKKELLEKMNIDSIVKILNYIECDRDCDDTEETLTVGDKKVDVVKQNNMVTIGGRNNPYMFVISKEVDSNELYDSGKRIVKIIYEVDSKNYVCFEGNASISESLIDKDALVEALQPEYLKVNSTDKVEFDDMMMPKGLSCSEEGIVYHNIVLSEDGKTILKINGEEIPSKEEIMDFDLESEKGKIDTLRNIIDLNEVSKKLLEDYIGKIDEDALMDMRSKLEKKSTYLKHCLKDYDSVTDKVSSMIEARDIFVEGVNNFEYSREELDGVAEWLSSLSDYKDKGFARVKEFGHSRG